MGKRHGPAHAPPGLVRALQRERRDRSRVASPSVRKKGDGRRSSERADLTAICIGSITLDFFPFLPLFFRDHAQSRVAPRRKALAEGPVRQENAKAYMQELVATLPTSFMSEGA